VSNSFLKSDFYVVIAEHNDVGNDSMFLSFFDEVRSFIAVSDVCLLYKVRSIIDTDGSFLKSQAKVVDKIHNCFKKFDTSLGIVGADIDITCLKDHCLCFPLIGVDEMTFSERVFQGKFFEVLEKTLCNKKESDLRNRFNKAVNENTADVFEFIKEILCGIPEHRCQSNGSCVAEFIERMSSDYQLLESEPGVFKAYCAEKKNLFDYFSSFSSNNLLVDWKQDVVRYLFYLLSSGVGKDCGMGVLFKQTEYYYSKLLFICETIIAKRLLVRFDIFSETSFTENYRNVMKSVFGAVDLFDNVYCRLDNMMLRKLGFASRNFSEVGTDSVFSLVLYNYYGSMRKILEYEILRNFFDSDNDCEKFVDTLSF
jgi:hypothetical protein